jgi:riboflavin kinase/FMN adenylyltransferase
MEELSSVYGYRLLEIPVHLLNSISVSSTRIREAVAASDIDTANRLLGYDFFFEGKVMEGNKLGKTIGFPTANLHVENEEKLLPGNGVYAVTGKLLEQAGIKSALLGGMMNIGFRPTVGGTSRVIEVNLFDFNRDIYGERLRVYVKKFLRSEQKFSGLDNLKDQLAKDRQEALLCLAAGLQTGNPLPGE